MALLLMIAAVLPLVAAVFEWMRIRPDVLSRDGTFPPPALWEAVPLWVLAAKTYVVLLAALLLSSAIVALRWHRTAISFFLIAATLTLFWTSAELETYSRTGAHVLFYLQFLSSPDAAKWAGDMSATLREALIALVPLIGVAAAAVLAAALAIAAAWRWMSPVARRWLVPGLILCHVVGIVLLFPAQRLAARSHRSDLQRLHDRLPFDLTWTCPGTLIVDIDAFEGPLNANLNLKETLPLILAGPPVDAAPWLGGDPARSKHDIVLIVIDSLRSDALVPEVMPRLSELTSRSLVLRQHYAGARITHFGLFNLLYGRPALAYRPTLRANVPPQASVSFRAAGYQTNYLAGVSHFDWMRMHVFLNEQTFDRLRITDVGDWPASDRQALATAARVLHGDEAPTAEGAPQFLTLFLASTHYPYLYPPEFDTRQPALDKSWGLLSLDETRDRQALLNRYRNACAFIDDEVGRFMEALDLSTTLVVVTGDHGESFWDDGYLIHGTRWSDAQLRVPCFILGPGIEPGERHDFTSHLDLLPTLLRLACGESPTLANTTGRDLFSNNPAPQMQLLGSDSDLERFQVVVRWNDRRLMLEVPHHRPTMLVKGTIDASGNVDPYDLPPASEAAVWAEHINALLAKMTALRSVQ